MNVDIVTFCSRVKVSYKCALHEQAGSAGISGLNSYYALEKIADYPYARRTELPSFTRSN